MFLDKKKIVITLQDVSSILHLIEAYEHRRNSEVNLKSLFGFRKTQISIQNKIKRWLTQTETLLLRFLTPVIGIADIFLKFYLLFFKQFSVLKYSLDKILRKRISD